MSFKSLALLRGLYLKNVIFVLGAPHVYRESSNGGWLGRSTEIPSPRILMPGGPHCVRRLTGGIPASTLKLWLGRSISFFLVVASAEYRSAFPAWYCQPAGLQKRRKCLTIDY